MVQWENKINELEILYVCLVCVGGASLVFSLGLLETILIFRQATRIICTHECCAKETPIPSVPHRLSSIERSWSQLSFCSSLRWYECAPRLAEHCTIAEYCTGEQKPDSSAPCFWGQVAVSDWLCSIQRNSTKMRNLYVITNLLRCHYGPWTCCERCLGEVVLYIGSVVS